MSSPVPVAFDAAFLAAPYATYARLRAQAPVHRAHTPDGSPIWLVTRYNDVQAALADPNLSVDKQHSTTGYAGFSLPPALDANLLNRDAGEHARLRGLVNQAFTPRRVQQLRPRIQHLADELTATLPDGQVEMMQAWAGPLPITVICELLGIPPDQRPNFQAWTDRMLAPQTSDDVRGGVAALHEYLLELISSKRRAPGSDVLSDLIAARDAGDHLDENELVSAAFVILFAGYENTVNLLGNGLAALLTHPEQLAALRARPERIPAAVEELLRFDPPPQLAIRRFALTDLELGGMTIPAGDTVMVSLASAHRDPRAYSDPDTLDIDRGCPAAPTHLGLGYGRHFCLGAALARTEAEIALTTLLRDCEDLRLAVDPAELAWRPSFRNRGLIRLPVALSRR
ncbi:hypothetical protein FHX42_005235 [Saccharopolyspora lacisalsi]|uniref:Cytochrome P450 n=1 Tax=Halosaccharopolyspora lacisalsi TaxID=1000566 RepID=A0A839EAF8_9PSEU|nr:cytochrome P450 [Halosaccharopolyspora lacisalsi]MBA8827828.1 hypothetical protein [Halosaccharopolyspora lacisalsi]